MGSSYVFRTLQAKPSIAAAFILVSLVLGLSVPASATQFQPSQTIKAFTRIACVLDERLDSSKLSYGDTFKLRVVDTTFPVLHGAEIIGYITESRKPSGTEQGKVGFWLTHIKLPNGEEKPITAYVLSRRVTNINPAAQYAARNAPPPMPNGFTTPGPVAWQMRLGQGGATVNDYHQGQTLGGYVYTNSWPIIVNAGTSVTVELAASLTIP
jgi:hypothetical protein